MSSIDAQIRKSAVASLPYSLVVRDFTLPERSHVKAIYDIGLGRDGERWWGKSPQQAYPEIQQVMAANRLSPHMIQPAPVFRYKDGKAAADFEAFDRAAHAFDVLKIPHSYTPQQFYLFGWGFPPRDAFGEHPYPGEPPFATADRSKLRPSTSARYQAAPGYSGSTSRARAGAISSSCISPTSRSPPSADPSADAGALRHDP